MRTSRALLIPLVFLATALASGCTPKSDSITYQLSLTSNTSEAESGKDGAVTANVSTQGGGNVNAFVGVQAQDSSGSWVTWSEPIKFSLPATQDFHGTWLAGDTNYRVALWSSKTALNEAPLATSSPIKVTGWDYRAVYDEFIAAETKALSGWPTYYQEQAKCLSLPNRRGNLSTFQSCFAQYDVAFKNVVALHAEYITFLNSFEVPPSITDEFRAYRNTVTIADTRLASMYEVFCTDEPHSTLDWYNCVGSSDVSESWDRYYVIQDDIIPTRSDLAYAFVDHGLPNFTD